MQRDTAIRKIGVSFTLDAEGLTARCERGCMVRLPLDCSVDTARKRPDFSGIFSRLGNTPYEMKHFTSELDPSVFIPAAELTELRRKAIAALDAANDSTYPYSYRKNENAEAMYMTDTLDYRDNVANRLAEQFYREHGVKKIERAIETAAKAKTSPLRVMTTRHCILRELRMCKKRKPKLQNFRTSPSELGKKRLHPRIQLPRLRDAFSERSVDMESAETESAGNAGCSMAEIRSSRAVM